MKSKMCEILLVHFIVFRLSACIFVKVGGSFFLCVQLPFTAINNA